MAKFGLRDEEKKLIRAAISPGMIDAA